MPVLRVDVEVEEVLGNSLIEKVIRKREVHSSCDFNLCDFPLQGRSGSTFPGYSLRAEKEKDSGDQFLQSSPSPVGYRGEHKPFQQYATS